MMLGNVSHRDFSFGTYTRPDKEIFDISVRLFELPVQYDYWMANYDAKHEAWGHIRFTLTLPKKIASTVDLAETVVGGTVLEQVKASLNDATASGRDLSVIKAWDGWVLI